MNKDEMVKVMQQMFEEESAARTAGQKEYASGSENAFLNFETLAKELNLDRKMILWVFFRKHVDGIRAYINGHKSQREDVRGRIKDARVYLALLRGMIEEEEAAVPPRPSVNPVEAVNPEDRHAYSEFVQRELERKVGGL